MSHSDKGDQVTMARVKRLEVRVDSFRIHTVTDDLAEQNVGKDQTGKLRIPKLEVSSEGEASFFWCLPSRIRVSYVKGKRGGKPAEKVVLIGSLPGPGMYRIEGAEFKVQYSKGEVTVFIELTKDTSIRKLLR